MAYKVRYINKKIYTAPFYTSQIIVQLIPSAPLKTTSKVLGWKGFSLMKFWKCQNLNSFFSEISFLELPIYSWNLQMVSITEKFKNLLARLWHGGTSTGWHMKMRSWHVFGSLAHGHADHASMHGTEITCNLVNSIKTCTV